jgi:hypothetical protein
VNSGGSALMKKQMPLFIATILSLIVLSLLVVFIDNEPEHCKTIDFESCFQEWK